MSRTLDTHPLRPLLAPRSIAVVGASNRQDSYATACLDELQAKGFAGAIYPVNPRYQSIGEHVCYASLAELPEQPDHAIMCVSNQILEQQMQAAASAGVPAATIFASGYLEEDTHDISLLSRLKRLSAEAGIMVCGGNCMGFRNLESNTHVSIMAEPDLRRGPVAFISHSGTAFGQMLALDGRAGYQLVVSAGQEHTVTVAQYIDYALSMPETRCIALFLETVREPEPFIAALERARALQVPVVAVKVGRSEAAARFAVTHSGAMVGNDTAYQALFERYGVIRVDDLGEMVNVIQLLCYGRPFADGGLAALMDSGGKRELMMDLLDRVGLRAAEISSATRSTLALNLDVGLDPVNPLDFWGTGFDWLDRVCNCATALADDEDSAICVLAGIICWAGSTGYVEILERAAARSPKAFAILTEFLRAEDVPSIERLNACGISVLVGEHAGLRSIERVAWYRRYLQQPQIDVAPPLPVEVEETWRVRLEAETHLDEYLVLSLLEDAGVNVPRCRVVQDRAAAQDVAAGFGYPVVLKTAVRGINHKTDVGGVHLGLHDAHAVRVAYDDLRERLGSRVLVAEQLDPSGVEMAVGIVNDPVSGPMVVVSAGGTLIELLDDKVCALAPVSPTQALDMVKKLKADVALSGVRGSNAMDTTSFAETISRFSALAWQLRDFIGELDANPVRVTTEGTTVLDGLLVSITPVV